jgi:hypothetical protein
MKRIFLIFAMVAVVALLAASPEDSPTYVGASKCKDCHRTDKQGKQYPIWEASLHAQAFNNLKTEGAKQAAAAAGITGLPEQAPACLKCHASLYEKAAGISVEGVTCETCHGPGSLYRKLNVMMSRDASVKNGLVVYASQDAIKAQCMTCHADAHGKTLDFAAAWEKIKHARPAK